MRYFNSHEVEVCIRGYIILEDVCYPFENTYIRDDDLPLDELDFLSTETIDPFFMPVQNTLGEKDSSNHGEHSLWRATYSYAISEAN